MAYSAISISPAIHAYFLSQTTATATAEPAAKTQSVKVAQVVADFINAAQHSIQIAIYDFRLNGESEKLVIDVLDKQTTAGRTVQIAYDHSKDGKTGEYFAALGSDPAPSGTHEKMTALHRKNSKIQVKPIVGPKLAAQIVLEPIETGGHLMHSKYILRDAGTPQAALLIGSANFTDDAWALQENNILTYIGASTLVKFYEADFEELWKSEKIAGTGKKDTGDATIGLPIHVMFSPGNGAAIEEEIGKRIAAAKHRLAIASMVISSEHILSALADKISAVPAFKGIYDSGEMDMVVKLWKSHSSSKSANGKMTSGDKAALFEKIAKHLHAKKSTKYSDTGPHDFMHNKLVVIDDQVITGSFNFSTSATHNAENVVFIESKDIADKYEKYVDSLLAQYKTMG
ncbi:MAG TPA: phospholipase D-like domain-containing protein [Stellaceae bacterium]|jgi:phosphatidylserine/phosphatidylglycerophosphate/cardiolipin synthase-like enzyme